MQPCEFTVGVKDQPNHEFTPLQFDQIQGRVVAVQQLVVILDKALECTGLSEKTSPHVIQLLHGEGPGHGLATVRVDLGELPFFETRNQVSALVFPFV